MEELRHGGVVRGTVLGERQYPWDLQQGGLQIPTLYNFSCGDHRVLELFKTNILRSLEENMLSWIICFSLCLIAMDFRDLKIDEYFFINFRCLKFGGIQIVHTHTRGRGGGQLNVYVPYWNEQFSYMKCIQGGGGESLIFCVRTIWSYWIFTFSQRSPLYSIFLSIGKAHYIGNAFLLREFALN